MRHVPEPLDRGKAIIVTDSNGQALGYVFSEDEPGRRSAAKLLSSPLGSRIGSHFATPCKDSNATSVHPIIGTSWPGCPRIACSAPKLLSKDEAREIAANIAKLPGEPDAKINGEIRKSARSREER
jgi:hypothetical protein